MGMNDTDIVMESVNEVACTSCQNPLDVSGLPAFTEIACPECHTPQVVPAKLGNFLLLGMLGKGGMGAVYRGLDTSLDRPVAVKVMLTSLGENKEFVATFRREAQAAAALNHPNIVQTYSFGVAHGQPYMVMELLDGGRFDQMIASGEPLNEALVLKIGADVAEGLNAAAGIGLVHGDVKPENILLDSNGVAKVVDFGLARFKHSGESSAQGIWGTPYYIAPEKIRSQPTDARSDIYSLGATLFHALAAKPPFDGETPLDVVKARLKSPAPSLATFRPDINPEVAAVIARTLEVEPAKRYPNYTSLLADLRKILATLKPPPSSFPQVSKRGGKIVLTKKKGGGRFTVSGLESAVAVAAATDAATATAPRRKMSPVAKLILIISLSLVGVLLLGGLLTWGIIAHGRAQERRLAAEKEQAELQAVRGSAGNAWADMLAAISNGVKCAATLKPLQTDAELERVAIGAQSANLTDAALAAESATSAAALAQAIAEAVTSEVTAGLTDLRAVTNDAATNLTCVLTATNPPAARAALTVLSNLLPRVAQGEQRIATAAGKAQVSAKDLSALKTKIAKIGAQQAEEKRRLDAEKAKAEREAQDAADAEKRAAALKESTSRERAEIEDARKTAIPLVLQCHFKEAADLMAKVKVSLATNEFKLAAERYTLMLELKAFVIDGIGKDAKSKEGKFGFGWNNELDVLGADDAKIMLRGRTEPWDHVTLAQMLRFAKRYTDYPEVDPKEAARACLATAVYVFEAGAVLVGDRVEPAKKLAKEYRDKAMARDPGLTEKASALLPDEALQPKEPTELRPPPTEKKPVEVKPVEAKPAEAKPAEAKPAEAPPVEKKPVEKKPVEKKPVEKKPAPKK